MSIPNFQALLLLCEALIPALSDVEREAAKEIVRQKVVDPDWDKVDEFLRQACTADDRFIQVLDRTISLLPDEAKKGFNDFLGTVSAGGETAAPLTGSTTPLAELPREHRTAMLQQWSVVPATQGLFSIIRKVTINAYLKVVRAALDAMEYSEHRPDSPSDVPEGLHRFQFYKFPSTDDKPVLDVDVVIVGSGGGGGVVGAKLASSLKGKKVAILEKGEFVPQEELPVDQADITRIYDNPLGGFSAADGSGVVVAGSTWGGSTTVNYAGALELPLATRKEWADKFGLSFANTPAFQECFDRVSSRMGVSSEHLKHSFANQVLIDGAAKLGLPCTPIPQNTGGHEHNCGRCPYGCRSGQKQAGTVSWLVDAEKNGAICVERCYVDKVLHENGRAQGLDAVLHDGRKLRVNATVVVLSGGALHTPCLLTRSGIENPLIGKNLKVHPCSYTIGYFDSKKTMPWEGSVMTAMISGYDKQRESPEYGAKLINMPFYPGLAGYMIPWRDPATWKVDVLRSKQSIWTAAILREWDSSGEVHPDPTTGHPVITSYTWTDGDKRSMIESMVTACRVQFHAGADQIQPVLNLGDLSIKPYIPAPRGSEPLAVQEAKLQEYLTYLRELGAPERLKCWASAHPQGTCRMGDKADNSVVDPEGKVWGYHGLYVADASLMPTATGSNPMLTTMALADWVAEKLIQSKIVQAS